MTSPLPTANDAAARTLSEYAQPIALRDGSSLLVRAMRPTDKAMLAALFRRLSPQSIRFRVFAGKSELTDRELDAATTLDFRARVALVALARTPTEERIVGVGRLTRVDRSGGPDANATTAEVAFTVDDAFQGRGLGTLLLEHLADIARSEGVERIEADVLASNYRMLEVFAESGFPAVRTLADGVYRVTFPIDATSVFLHASGERERHAEAASMIPLLTPRSIAVVGASSRQGSIGGAILANLVRCGFKGSIYAVNPHATEIAGVRCYPAVTDIPAPVDLVVVAVPATGVEAVVQDCVKAKARSLVIISAGFAETAGGKEVEQRIATLAREAGMRLVGPNCMGILNADPAVSMNATFAPSWPPHGGVSMLSQSGALGLAMLDRAATLHMGIKDFVSIGNKADVSANDLLSFWSEDPQTRVIALYLESFGNPRKFARIAPDVARRKPIVAVKSGRSAAGTRAAASHSAALASLDVGVDALFAQAGVVRTNTLEELFDVVTLLSTQPLPQGRRIGVVTNAGGPGILLADACEAHGLTLPALTAPSVEALKAFLPSQASVANPVDMIASATPDQYARAIDIVGADPNVDALVVIYIPPLVTQPEQVAAAVASAAGRLPSSKPIATVFMGSQGAPPALSGGARGPLPSYAFPENAAMALAAAVRCAEWRTRPKGKVALLERDRARLVRQAMEGAAPLDAAAWMNSSDALSVLRSAGLPLVSSERAAANADAAVAVADRVGYPVALKAIAPGLVHKSDAGGVALDLRSEADVRRAVGAMAERVAAAGYALEGLLVQRFLTGGVEALVGMTTDPTLGPLIVAGLGGVNVELVKDVAFRISPVSDLDAEEMVASLRTAKLLDGYRGAPALDRQAFVGLIQRVSALAEAFPEIREMELNPVQVLRRGEGVVAVDARVRLASAPSVLQRPV